MGFRKPKGRVTHEEDLNTLYNGPGPAGKKRPRRFTERERREFSVDPKLRQRAVIDPPRTSADLNRDDLPVTPLHPLEDGNVGVVRTREEQDMRRGCDSLNLRSPADKRRGGNAALKLEFNNDGTPKRDGARVQARKKGKTKHARYAPDPREACPHCGERITFSWLTPRQEFVQSTENWGEGPDLKEVAARWNMPYSKAKALRKNEGWDDERDQYQDALHEGVKTHSIQGLTKEIAEMESMYVQVSRAILARVLTRLKAQKNKPLDVKNDKDLMTMINLLNRVHRRNLGVSETSHEVKAQAAFVRTVFQRVEVMISNTVRDPEQLELIAYEMQQMRVDMDPALPLLPSG